MCLISERNTLKWNCTISSKLIHLGSVLACAALHCVGVSDVILVGKRWAASSPIFPILWFIHSFIKLTTPLDCNLHSERILEEWNQNSEIVIVLYVWSERLFFLIISTNPICPNDLLPPNAFLRVSNHLRSPIPFPPNLRRWLCFYYYLAILTHDTGLTALHFIHCSMRHILFKFSRFCFRTGCRVAFLLFVRWCNSFRVPLRILPLYNYYYRALLPLCGFCFNYPLAH